MWKWSTGQLKELLRVTPQNSAEKKPKFVKSLAAPQNFYFGDKNYSFNEACVYKTVIISGTEALEASDWNVYLVLEMESWAGKGGKTLRDNSFATG